MNSDTNIKRSLLYGVIVFVLSIFFHSCTMYKEVEVKEVLAVNITEFSTDGLSGDVQVSITNPNWYKIKLKECHVDFTLDGKPLGCADLMEQISIPPRTTSTQTFTIKASPEQMQALLSNAISMMFRTEYELKGTGQMRGKALLFSKRFPIDFSEKLHREDLGF